MIGRAIKKSAEYLPIRNHAASIATRARPKDYLGQLSEIYKDFIGRWRYVRDPAHKELVTASPRAVAQYSLALDGKGLGEGKGGGDCDCATVAIGAELLSTGFPVRIATTAEPKLSAGNLFGHVFPQAHVPGIGWVTVDPVLHPHKPVFSTAPHSRIAYWSLEGDLLGYSGNVRGLNGSGLQQGEISMYGEDSSPSQWEDLSGFLGIQESTREPDPWESVGLKDWGYLAREMGIINGDEMPGLVEVIPDAQGFARTPMLELSPEDYRHMKVWRQPYDGMLALGDDGTVYAYDGTLGRGFFRRLFRRIHKGIKKIAKKIKKGLRFVISKLPGGKWILKIADKIHKIAMKIIKPLMKFVGKYASKLAPFAALIPGFGPAIAAGLHVAGKIAQVYNRFSKVIKIMGKKGKARTLVPKKKGALQQMQRELADEAMKLKRHRERRGRG